jgi:AmpD protein
MFEIDTRSGLVKTVRFVPSPNCDTRPMDSGIDVLVIHAISLPPGEFGGHAIERLFCNCLDPDEHPAFREIHDLEVSAHLLIRRDGELVQFVPFHLRAWHAGQSSCEGRTRVNDFSVGIELEGTDDVPFEVAQYEVLTNITRALMSAYPAISRERIYGHCHIATGRKTDPGPYFDWERYLTAL